MNKRIFVIYFFLLQCIFSYTQDKISIDDNRKLISSQIIKRTLDSLSRKHKVKVVKYNIYETDNKIIKTILYMNPQTKNLIEKTIFDEIKWTWNGRLVTKKELRDSLKVTYLRYCDSLAKADD